MKIIGISGKSGSGKTTLINAVRDKYTSDQVCIISLDNYYKDRRLQVKDEMGYYNFDLMDSFNWDLAVSDLNTLRSGKIVKKKQYVFNKECEDSYIEWKPAEVLLIEGIFIFSQSDIWDMLDYSIIIEAPNELCRARRLARDESERNYRKEEILHRYDNHFMPAYRELVEPMKPKVNLVLYNEEKLEIARKILLGKVASFL